MKTILPFKFPRTTLNFSFFFVLALLGSSFLMAQNPNSNVDGGFISTEDETTICVDGFPDPINVTVEGASGRLKQWIITDDQNNILALPPAPPFNLDGAGPGVCRIWHLSYNGIPPFKKLKNLSDLRGRYDLSNYIEVVRNLKPEGGTLTGGENNIFTFCVDGEADNIPEGAITLEGNIGSNSVWVVTDLDLNILGLPPTPSAPNFDAAGAGTCLVWHLSFEGDPETFLDVTNAGDLEGCFELSNPITVIRYEADGGILEGGSFEYCVGDGEADNIPEGDITLSGNVGNFSQWIVTDSEGMILGTPPNPFVVDFDGAGDGTCVVYHLSAFGEVEGATAGSNIADISGCYDLSNGIDVVRNQPEGGTITGGDNNTFTFNTVGDGQPDQIAEGAVTIEGSSGENATWVVTDEDLNILGLPPTASAPNFDGAGPGTCLLWYMRYAGDVDLSTFSNVGEFDFCFDLSNSISVIRNEGNAGRSSIIENPASDVLNVKLGHPSKKGVSLQLFNMSNEPVIETSTTKQKAQLNIQNLSPGLYFLRVEGDSGQPEILRVVIN
ncbi:T9SS type A sorting domain-containing protein [Winogradskyella maritima]|uniref:T9SS type A sorting domain-containing protein n=1 Tax=Winogradskyella maritima TaxID=1517766 RepID=A0ABV8AKF1_9FLAO|nr:T9SS type A sorting domain-containing protein [Winogradskyella maritima]